MRPDDCSLLATVAVGVLLSSLPARAQPMERVGNFAVVTDPATAQQGSSVAAVAAEGGSSGEVMWGCAGSGLTVAITLRTSVSERGSRPLIWRFDDDPADSTSVLMGQYTRWHLRPHEVARFTERARTARRLVIRSPRAGEPGWAELTYDLRGAPEALGRLACVRDPSAPLATPPDWPREYAVPPDDGTYELGAVEVLPRIINGAEFSRLMVRSIPPELRAPGTNGRVTLRYRVLENGRVDAASVRVLASTHEAMNQPVIQAVRQLRLAPARVNGRPVKVWIEQPFDFGIGTSPAPPTDPR
jgi:TonB family protein